MSSIHPDKTTAERLAGLAKAPGIGADVAPGTGDGSLVDDPAVRAVEQTRLTAERMMYYFERAPLLLSWQVELMTYRVADQPAAQMAYTDRYLHQAKIRHLDVTANQEQVARLDVEMLQAILEVHQIEHFGRLAQVAEYLVAR